MSLTKNQKENEEKEFEPAILELEDFKPEKPVVGGPMMSRDPRCSMNGPPPCPPASKCKK